MKRTFQILLAPAFAASLISAEVINVADHGIVPGQDVSAKVNQLLESLEGQVGQTLFFPRGTYEFFPEHAVEKYRAVTNHDNSLKKLAFPIYNFDKLTIDGGGSTFMFNGRMSPFVVQDSKGTVLKNFKIDWDTPFHHELKVVESEPETKSFVAEVYPTKYGVKLTGSQIWFGHYNWHDEIGQNQAFDPETSAPIWLAKQYGLNRKRAKVSQVGENKYRFEKACKLPPPVGTVICTYGNGPTNRLAQAIHLSSSDDTLIEDVTVYAAGGMALIAERCENVELNRMIVTSTEDRIMSTRADATHFLGCKGLVKLENCRFEHMADDGINVHGAYVKINEYKGDKTFLCEISHRQQAGLIFAEKGDKVYIGSRVTILPIYETTVTDVEILDESKMLITVEEVPGNLPDEPLSMENVTWYPNVVLRNNVMRDNRARSALISTKGDVLIEKNVFSSSMHGILIEGDNNKWYESGGVRNVTIDNNTFENVGYGTGEAYPLYAAPLLLPDQRVGEQKYHWNIRFTNNRLKSYNGLLAHAFNVRGLVISGNVVEVSEDYPKGSALPSIELDYCEDVLIEKNHYIGYHWPIRVEQSDNSTNVMIRENTGITEENE